MKFWGRELHQSLRGDEGRIGLMFSALVAVVLALCLLAGTIAGIHLQYRRALACADSLALAGSRALSGGDYYCETCSQRAAIDTNLGRQAVLHAAQRLSANMCKIGTAVTVGDVKVNASDISVDVRVNSELLLHPPVLGDLVAPVLNVQGKARLLHP